MKNKVAELVHNKTIEGIADYHSDLKNGIKITITLKKDANAQVVLNKLYKHTSFQTTYGIIFLMLDQGVPKTLCLKDIIVKYIDFQREVIIRRTKYDLDVAEKRVHILEGLKIALDNIDAVIKLIRAAKSDDEARTGLMNNFKLSEIQANAILEMKLRRLTGLEREKIENELNDLLKLIEELRGILASDSKILEVIKNELLEIKEKYGDERRTNIDMTAIEYIEDESLIPNEDVIITLTRNGYIKRLRSDTYRTQNRGGVGVNGMTTHEEDFVEQLISMKTHDYILFFSNKGRVYRMKGYEVPEFSRQSKGLPIINLLQLDKDENISSIVEISASSDDIKYLVFATKNGIVKRTDISEFNNIRKSGKIAIVLKENDELISVRKTCGKDEVAIGANNGRMVRFVESEIRPMGRSSSGVKGIDLDGSYVIGSEVVNPGQEILIITDKGYGKRTVIDEYRLTHRGSKGVKALNITEKNGTMVALKRIESEEYDIVIVTDNGTIMKMPLNQVSLLRRATQGVRLINLKNNELVSTVALVTKEEEDN